MNPRAGSSRLDTRSARQLPRIGEVRRLLFEHWPALDYFEIITENFSVRTIAAHLRLARRRNTGARRADLASAGLRGQLRGGLSGEPVSLRRHWKCLRQLPHDGRRVCSRSAAGRALASRRRAASATRAGGAVVARRQLSVLRRPWRRTSASACRAPTWQPKSTPISAPVRSTQPHTAMPSCRRARLRSGTLSFVRSNHGRLVPPHAKSAPRLGTAEGSRCAVKSAHAAINRLTVLQAIVAFRGNSISRHASAGRVFSRAKRW